MRRFLLAASALLALSTSAMADCAAIPEVISQVSKTRAYAGHTELSPDQVSRAKAWMDETGDITTPVFDVALVVLRSDGILTVFVGQGGQICGYALISPTATEGFVNAVFGRSL
jgi:hypothetical protein